MLELIGPKIKEAREEINMSQKDLGMALGLSDKAVSAYEASRTIPPLETLIRIAEELNKPLDYFINRNAPDYSVETKLASMQRNLHKMTDELKGLTDKVLSRIDEQQKEEHTLDTESSNPGTPENNTPKNTSAAPATPLENAATSGIPSSE